MAKQPRRRRTRRNATKAPRRKPSFTERQRSNGSKTPRLRRPGVLSDVRLERALRVLNETKDLKTAARSIRISAGRFVRAANRKGAIRRQGGNWIVARRLFRKTPVFSGGRQLAITVRSNSVSLIGRYMSAVGRFLQTNDPKFLADFKGRSVKDVRGKVFPFETNPERAVPAFVGRRGAVRGTVQNRHLNQGARQMC